MAKKLELEITVDWRPIKGESTPEWRRLWNKLLANRKVSATYIQERSDDVRWTHGKDRNTPNV